MAYKPGERPSPETEFKPGSAPCNKLPIGSVTHRTHKYDRERAWVKIAEPNIWIINADFVWMQHGGTIPRGFVVHHLDGDTLNDGIGNLALVSRAHHINTHREALHASKIGMVLPLKDTTCSVCSKAYQSKAQRKNGLCPECRQERRRIINARYRTRIRAERRR
jgi:predicted Zn-ribbon and HTH transcriptional regulator